MVVAVEAKTSHRQIHELVSACNVPFPMEIWVLAFLEVLASPLELRSTCLLVVLDMKAVDGKVLCFR